MKAQTTTELTIAARTEAVLESLQQSVLTPFLDEWPRSGETRAGAAAALPVLRWLPAIASDDAAFAKELVGAVCRAAPNLAWAQTYSADDLGSVFLDNYGWSELIGGTGPLASARLVCGFLILGPSTHYPAHRHEAEEIYLPLSGTAAWQQGDAVWRQRSPGTVIRHAADEPHAMRTGANPLLALYLWRGSGIARKAQLDVAGGSP